MKTLNVKGYDVYFDDEDYDRLLENPKIVKKLHIIVRGPRYYLQFGIRQTKIQMTKWVMQQSDDDGRKLFMHDGNQLNLQKSNLYYKVTLEESLDLAKSRGNIQKSERIKMRDAGRQPKVKKSKEVPVVELKSDTPELEEIKLYRGIKIKMKKRSIVNVAICNDGSWYTNGQERLYHSVREVGDTTDFRLTNSKPNGVSPYVRKVQAIIDAYKAGAKQILYLDCSIMAIKSLEPIWEYIEENGYYLYASGYNCAQTSNDRCLDNFGLTRDTAETFHEAATNVIGINVKHWIGEKLIKELMMDYIPECIESIKWPTPEQRLAESKDPRFLHSRQDQTVISLIAGKYKLKLEDHNHFVWRDEEGSEKPNDSVIFRLKGGY